MKNLTPLVKEYLKTKSSTLLTSIFKELEQPLLDKAKYAYYEQSFCSGEYNIDEYNKKSKKFEPKTKKAYIKLKNTHEVDFSDVLQSLRLHVLLLFSKWEQKVPFEHYLLSSLKYWKPHDIIKEAFKKEIRTLNNSELTTEDDSTGIDRYCIIEPTQRDFQKEAEDKELVRQFERCFQGLTKSELKVINLLKNNPELKQSQVAEILNVKKQRVSQIYAGLRKKYKGRLDF